MTTKTPVTLTAAERQAQLAKEGKLPVSAAPQSPPKDPPKSVSVQDLRARLREGAPSAAVTSLAAAVKRNLVPDEPFPNAAAGLKPGDDFDGATMSLETAKVRPYDRNPRRVRNPKYAEIEASVRAKGIINPVTVTRRPGSKEYMIYGGGNTRLEILQKAHEEQPQNPLYARMTVIYRAWRGEADVTLAHLIENEARGDTSFWDKACGLMQFKGELETQLGAQLNIAELRKKATEMGWSVSHSTIQIYEFATGMLAPIGAYLTLSAVQAIKDQVGKLHAVMTRLDNFGGSKGFNAVLANELEMTAAHHKSAASDGASLPGLSIDTDRNATAVELDAALFCASLEERVAAAVNASVAELRQMLALVSNNPTITASTLRTEAAKGVVTATRSTVQTATKPATEQGGAGAAPVGLQDTQLRLNTPMLATGTSSAQPSAPGSTVAPGAEHPNDATAFLNRQGPLPTELAQADEQSATSPGQATGAPVAQEDTTRSTPGLLPRIEVFRELGRLAVLAGLHGLLVIAERMPLGYFMELPLDGRFPHDPTSEVERDEQVRAAKAAWQFLAVLSSQFDQRTADAGVIPTNSRWWQAQQSGMLSDSLWACGITVSSGNFQLDAQDMFYLWTHPQLSPCIARALGWLEKRRAEYPEVLPPTLVPIEA